MHAKLGYCFFPLVDVALLMCVGRNGRHLDDGRVPWLKSLSRCAHDLIDQWRTLMMLHVIGWDHLPYEHMPRQCMDVLDNSICQWPITLLEYAYSTFVFACLGWSRRHVGNVSYQFPTGHVRCMHNLADVILLLADISRSMRAGYKWCW